VRAAFLIFAIGPLTLGSATPAFAAMDNDWPDVEKSCSQVAHPDASDTDPLWKRTVGCATGFFTARPIHVTIKSVVPGGGTGAGPTFEADFNTDRWQRKFVATEVTSLRGFWMAEGTYRLTHQRFGASNSARDRFAVDFYANSRGLPQMAYYGIGPHTSTAGLTDFAERDVAAGADIFNPLSAWIAVGGKVESIWPQITGDNDPGVRSITALFNETTAPGIAAQPNLIHYEIYGEPRRTRGKFQFDYKVAFNQYQDHQTGHYSFHRFFVDGTHPFHPTGSKDELLTIHERLSISGTSGSNVVPFYMMETLGGSNIDGDPTLRGFADYRFRGNDLLLIQTEYDRRIWGPLGVLGFYDAGEVANRVSDLSFSDMRQSFGFGIGIWAGEKIWFKASVGLGSGEGRHTYFGIPSF
jgi:hypothetical protein